MNGGISGFVLAFIAVFPLDTEFLTSLQPPKKCIEWRQNSGIWRIQAVRDSIFQN